jgi:eukaryotic-like serine/threonine-protein kinase
MVDGAASAPATWVGRELGGYALLGELGTGGMGIVFLGEHRLLGRRAAIKTIRPEIAAIPTFERRFLLEARAIAGLDHPSIVKLYDFAFSDDAPYMVMEFVTGKTLQEELADHGPLSVDDTLNLIGPVASALDHAHEHGVVHRDVKPGNILLADDGRTLVMDFGLACLQGYTMATDPDSFLGTPDYIAPEQITSKSVDGEADVYSLAAVIYECVTGRRPFSGKSWIEIASKRLTEPAPIAEDVPEAFARELAAGMAKEPEDRPKTAGELLERLARAVAPAAASEPPDEGQPAAADDRRDVVGTAAIGITAVCMATLVVVNELLLLQPSMLAAGSFFAKTFLGR